MLNIDITSPPPSCRSLLPAKSPVVSPDRRITKKYRRAYIRKLKEREYRRLRAVVPALAHRNRVTKVAVIEEAIRYIDELHQTLLGRIHEDESENCDCCTTKAEVVSGTHQLFAQFHKAPLTPLSMSNVWEKGTMTSDATSLSTSHSSS